MNKPAELTVIHKTNDKLAYIDRATGNVGLGAKRLISAAWRALLAFDLPGAQQLVAQLRTLVVTRPLQQRLICQQADLIAAAIALLKDDIENAMHLAGRVAEGEQTEEMARVTSVLLRFGAWSRRNWEYFEAATCLCPCSLIDGRQALPTVLTLIIEAAAEMKRCHFISAHRLASDALRFAARLKSGRAMATTGAITVMAAILYEQGEVDEADKLLRRHLDLFSQSACADAAVTAYETLIRIAMNRCQWAVAATFQRDVIALGNARSWSRLTALGYAAGTEGQCLMGAATQAAVSATRLRRLWEEESISLLRTAIASRLRESEIRLSLLANPPAQLASDIELHLHDLTECGEVQQTFGMAMLLVEALDKTGASHIAQTVLLDYVRAGMQRGMFQTFVMTSPVVHENLSQIYNDVLGTLDDQAQLRPFLASLIARTRKFLLAKAGSGELFTEAVITARERDILLRMSQGYSNKKIAKDLGIGPETVKSHAKRIYFKLGVTSRIEAVTQAADLSLI
ncbi:response regulator transcription factor [Herbaspirillum frisingense]|uniref:helix-turn-helix transcriptional regulator n=1 Tax=Herbaspirillum frisingense TaxID=92645 RepID=UPI001602BD27|nr:LuxR C-terminal-related transcriptional regulator [Herbaspirillum frisingense]QNB06136.1 response regulator transcription factor [Herbaspirillum frisingense]